MRYAVYYCPEPGPLARFGAAWLGWDTDSGHAVAHPGVAGLPVAEITATPRKYGLHGTMKPPFALAAGQDEAALRAALKGLCATRAPLRLDGLRLTRLGQFLALTGVGGQGAMRGLSDLAGTVVRDLDRFRAPPSEAERARRDAGGLTPAQRRLLARWGYPFVMDEFRFHITLSGKLEPAMAERVEGALEPLLAPLLPAPFVVDHLTLVKSDDQGRFHVVQRYPLTGRKAVAG